MPPRRSTRGTSDVAPWAGALAPAKRKTATPREAGAASPRHSQSKAASKVDLDTDRLSDDEDAGGVGTARASAKPPSSTLAQVPNGRLTRAAITLLLAEDASSDYCLDAHARGVAVVDDLNALPKLRSLDLSFNKLTSISGLEGAPELRDVKLYSNTISSMDGLHLSPKLESVSLGDNLLDCLDPAVLRALPKLRSLKVNRNSLTALKPLSKSALSQ